uniref:Uncharacterized protein n=1 Tax=Lepeophtheirus salmonis TaxID=72036 RepID=A0A0K2TJW1_LEPSM
MLAAFVRSPASNCRVIHSRRQNWTGENVVQTTVMPHESREYRTRVHIKFSRSRSSRFTLEAVKL